MYPGWIATQRDLQEEFALVLRRDRQVKEYRDHVYLRRVERLARSFLRQVGPLLRQVRVLLGRLNGELRVPLESGQAFSCEGCSYCSSSSLATCQ